MSEISQKATAEVSKQNTLTLIGSARRYFQHAIVIIHKGGKSYRTIETFEMPPLPKPSEKGIVYFKITLPNTFRPDKIAYMQLGDQALWWWILLSNGLFDCSQIQPGKTLKVSRPPAEVPRFLSGRPA